jgi:2'-5' RNA ligase
VRLFTGITLDDQAAQRVDVMAAALRASLEQRAPRARLTWIPASRLHFTVRFIGDVPDARADAVRTAFRAPLQMMPFSVTLTGVGMFPLRGAPRVIWVGVSDGEQQMMAIEREVSARLAAAIGLPPERSYMPHLTLARVRDAAGLHRQDVAAAAPAGPIGVTHVEAITLFQSQLSPRGPTYLPLESLTLRWSQ